MKEQAKTRKNGGDAHTLSINCDTIYSVYNMSSLVDLHQVKKGLKSVKE